MMQLDPTSAWVILTPRDITAIACKFSWTKKFSATQFYINVNNDMKRKALEIAK